MSEKRYRVAQWGTGFSGMVALRAVIEHPEFRPGRREGVLG